MPLIRHGIQRILVDACNDQGWEIPFTQITLHQAPGRGWTRRAFRRGTSRALTLAYDPGSPARADPSRGTVIIESESLEAPWRTIIC